MKVNPIESKFFRGWYLLKTYIQLYQSCVSLNYILESGFFTKNYNTDLSINYKTLFLTQAIFEVLDALCEGVWYFRKRQRVPWDSVFHHIITGSYYQHLYYNLDKYENTYLGLAAAGVSCQFIGFYYNMNRLKIKHKTLTLCMLIVQLCYRNPLAIVSIIRAFQYSHLVPDIHFVMCFLLFYLDVKWTGFIYKEFKKVSS